jgi:hypothetical protein
VKKPKKKKLQKSNLRISVLKKPGHCVPGFFCLLGSPLRFAAIHEIIRSRVFTSCDGDREETCKDSF